MRMRPVIALLSVFVLCGFKINSGEKDYVEFRPHMRAVYASMMKVLPLALNKGSFSNSDNAKTIQENLNLMAENAAMINKIASKHEKGHMFFSSQMEKLAGQAAQKFKDGNEDQAHFFVQELYDTCLGCHTSRTSSADSQFTADFTKEINLDALGTFGKAKFLALSRQFDKALTEYERIFATDSLSLEDLLHFDPFVDYLVLAIRVKGEPDRVIKTLALFDKKPLPGMIKHDLEIWLTALRSLKGPGKNQGSLAFARELIAKAKTVIEYPRDRGGIVYYMLASKYLKDSLKQTSMSEKDKAETYYYLGICEMGIGEPFLAIESAMYLVEAIRLAPKAEFAKKAFGLYEENLLYGYSGSSGTSLPVDEQTKLDELRKMVF